MSASAMPVTPQVWALAKDGRAPTPDRIADVVRPRAALLGEEGAAQARTALAAKVLGAGPLEPFLSAPGVTDVLVNGVEGVWIDDGCGLRRTSCEIGGPEEVRRLAVRLAAHAGRRLDDASPYVDGRLPGGVRLHAILPPLVDGATHISLRIPMSHPPTLDQLVGLGAMPPMWAETLREVVAARLSFVVSGGTGSGKTTLLAATLDEVPHQERLVVVEDVRELALRHPHAVRLEARPANVEGRGGIDLVSLVRQSLRMRPDRLVVGEVRGGEVRELLTALNTGHEGGAGTLHANRLEDVIARFEALGALAGLSPESTRAQVASAIEVVIHLRRGPAGRRVEAIGVLARDSGRLAVDVALDRHQEGGRGLGWQKLRQRLGRP